MFHVLLVAVRLHEGRYHGADGGPPSPARLFQALVAGAGISGPLREAERDALTWLENLDPPMIGSPRLAKGQSFKNYVPNNDLDAKGGDQRRIAEVRTSKIVQPLLFDPHIPFVYAWRFPANENGQHYAGTICALAERLYQFGRGIDMAWAWGEELAGESELGRRLMNYPGSIYRPSPQGGRPLPCPRRGTLENLMSRYAANAERFRTEKSGRKVTQSFSQPPKVRFAQIAYESPPTRMNYELRERGPKAPFAVWPLERAAMLVETLRNAAAARLRDALPAKNCDIERILVGRKANGADSGPTSLRVKIVPLPSIGHPHADRGIRRVLVEIPSGGPLRSDDMNWAFTGTELASPIGGEPIDVTPTEVKDMLKHYGVDGRFRVWHTVTPVALPESARRRRIDPARLAHEAKDGAERCAEQRRAAAAVFHALRHAQVRCHPDEIRVQREPFEINGQRVEAFAKGTRFAKERLWHVQIRFSEPITGPLVIGDGRFLGLGVMAPARSTKGIHVFAIKAGLVAEAQPNEAARALRRAVIARVQQARGANTRLPAFFTGHELDGSVARSETSPHLTFLFDPAEARLLIVAPHVIDQRSPTRREEEHLAYLDAAMIDFRQLRAGLAGHLILSATSVDPDSDRLFVPSHTWVSVTPYQVTRHRKRVGAAVVLAMDVRAECQRRGLPMPHVTPLDIRGVPKVGLVARVCLKFDVTVNGPIILGRSRHLGGGLFESVPKSSEINCHA